MDVPSNDEPRISSDAPNRSILVDPFIGIILADRYQLVELIDTGGFGRVYKAKQLNVNTDLAVKILHHEHLQDDVSIKRFAQEAQVLSRVQSPHVVRVVDFGSEPAPYLVMEYFSGTSLSKLIKTDGPMPAEKAIEVFLQLCDAMAAAESMHIVHRDLKPSNILLKYEQDKLLCKVLDFGIAKFVDAYSSEDHLTTTGEILGSPAYMAPEQWKGESDNRSDIYSLGCIMYEVLSGKPPFSAQFGMEYMNKHLSEVPVAISQLNASLPPGLENIVFKCMQKTPANRYQSVLQCSDDLKKLMSAGKVSVALPEQREARRKKILIPGLAIIFASFLAAYFSQVNIGNLLQAHAPSFIDPEENAQDTTATQPIRVHVGLRSLPEKWQDKTLSQWSELVEKNPSDPGMLFGRGQLHLYRREYGEARHDFDKVLQIDPNFADAYVERSLVYAVGSVHSEHEKAMADANAAVKLKPNWSRGYFARAYVYEWTEQNEPAIVDSKKAMELGEIGSECEPSYVNNFENLSNAYMKVGKYDEALETIEHGMRLVPSKFLWLLCRQKAMVLCYKQEFASAIQNLDVAIKEKHCGPSAWSLKAYCLAAQGKIHDAEQTCVATAKLETEPEGAYHRRAEFWRTLGNYEQAIQDLNKSILLQQSKDYYSIRLRGLCYLEQGKLHQALEDLQDAAILNPFSAKTFSYLALIESKLGEREKAQKDIAKAFAFPTHFPIMYVNRAKIELDQKQADKALTDLNTAISKDPYLKEAYALRKTVNEQLGRSKDALHDEEMSKSLMSHFEWIP